MQTQCIAQQLEFERVGKRRVVAAFDGGAITSDAGALLLRSCDRAIGLLDQLVTCFDDHRDPAAIEYPLRVLVGKRVLGMALGHEDLIDHEQLRHDELLAAMLGRLQSGRRDCGLLAGKSTLNRLELFEDQGASRYKRICPDEKRIERLFVDLFIQACPKPPRED